MEEKFLLSPLIGEGSSNTLLGRTGAEIETELQPVGELCRFSGDIARNENARFGVDPGSCGASIEHS